MSKFKIIIFILVAGLCLAQCKEDKEELLKPSLKLNRAAVVFESDLAASAEFDVNCNVEWEIITNQEWLTATPASGDGKSIVTVTISVPDNDRSEERTGIVTVRARDLREQVTVSQSKMVTLTFSKPEVELEDAIMPAAVAVITVKSDADWELSSKPDWYTVFPVRGKASTKPVVLTISSQMNSTPGPREGEFVLKTDTREFALKVKQKKAEDRFFGSSDSIFLSDKGSNGDKYYRFFRFTSSAPWEATIDNNFVMEPSTGEGSILIKVYAKSENNTGAERKGKITFNDGSRSLDVPIIQGWVGNYWNDEDLKVVNQHTKGKGVPIVVMGDGYDREDLKKGGWWETMGGKLVYEIMYTEVIRDMWDYLDVYLMMNESDERGVLYPDYPRNNTKFGAYGADENQGKCEEAARRAVNGLQGVTDSVATAQNGLIRIAFLANGPYPGNATNPMARGGIWEDGYGYWAVHEFVGHVLSDLPDMYWSSCNLPTNGDGTMPPDGWYGDGGITWSIAKEHPHGFNWFIDWRQDHPVWEEFIGAPGYSGETDGAPYYGNDNIGVYPTTWGGMFCKDLYGPSPVTTMREHYLCFDLGSRMQIYNKILDRAGIKIIDEEVNSTTHERVITYVPPERTLAAFKEFDKNRTRQDCRQGWGYEQWPRKFSWSQYCSETGKLKDPTAHYDYDSFWQRIWPPKGNACN
jgi:hypothetical protein